MVEVRDRGAFVIGPLTTTYGSENNWGVRDSAHTRFYSFHATVDEAALEASRISGQNWIGVWDEKFWTGATSARYSVYIIKFKRLFSPDEREQRIRTEFDYDILERIISKPLLVTDRVCLRLLGWGGPEHLESISRPKAERFKRLGLITVRDDSYAEITELGSSTLRSARYVESLGRPTKLPE